MTIPSVPPESISQAMRLFDKEMRGTHDWQGWEQRENYKYAIEGSDGLLYPIKKMIMMATGLNVLLFNGGESSGSANEYVRQRGFEVVELRKRNPVWSRDELILALDLYLQRRENIPSKESADVRELSETLNKLGEQIHSNRYQSFRNLNGVYLRLMNYRSLDPQFPDAQGMSHAGKGAEDIWHEFSSNPHHCHETATAIRKAIDELKTMEADDPDFEDEGITEADEGRAVTKVHIRRERSRKLVERKKKTVLKKTGKLECEACGFRFEKIYGDRGDGFIECHHTKPVHTLEPGETTKLKELALLCSNCHRMVHSKRPWLSIDELRSLPGIKTIRALFQKESG